MLTAFIIFMAVLVLAIFWSTIRDFFGNRPMADEDTLHRMDPVNDSASSSGWRFFGGGDSSDCSSDGGWDSGDSGCSD